MTVQEDAAMTELKYPLLPVHGMGFRDNKLPCR